MKIFKRIGIVVLIVLVVIQLIPTKTNQSSEVSSTAFSNHFITAPDVSKILSTSCYDCHSNNTNYPWYNKVQPVGWFLENHIQKGKNYLNFSEFASYSTRKQKSKLKAMIGQIEIGAMPIPSYTFIHRNTRLSEENKETLTRYLNSIQDSLNTEK